jgi:hypothetical protein
MRKLIVSEKRFRKIPFLKEIIKRGTRHYPPATGIRKRRIFLIVIEEKKGLLATRNDMNHFTEDSRKRKLCVACCIPQKPNFKSVGKVYCSDAYKGSFHKGYILPFPNRESYKD